MSLDHDSSYKYLFSVPEMVRDLIMGFVPDEWLRRLDYATLESGWTAVTSPKTFGAGVGGAVQAQGEIPAGGRE